MLSGLPYPNSPRLPHHPLTTESCNISFERYVQVLDPLQHARIMLSSLPYPNIFITPSPLKPCDIFSESCVQVLDPLQHARIMLSSFPYAPDMAALCELLPLLHGGPPSSPGGPQDHPEEASPRAASRQPLPEGPRPVPNGLRRDYTGESSCPAVQAGQTSDLRQPSSGVKDLRVLSVLVTAVCLEDYGLAYPSMLRPIPHSPDIWNRAVTQEVKCPCLLCLVASGSEGRSNPPSSAALKQAKASWHEPGSFPAAVQLGAFVHPASPPPCTLSCTSVQSAGDLHLDHKPSSLPSAGQPALAHEQGSFCTAAQQETPVWLGHAPRMHPCRNLTQAMDQTSNQPGWLEQMQSLVSHPLTQVPDTQVRCTRVLKVPCAGLPADGMSLAASLQLSNGGPLFSQGLGSPDLDHEPEQGPLGGSFRQGYSLPGRPSMPSRPAPDSPAGSSTSPGVELCTLEQS